MLAEAGVDASGLVVAGDPFDAARRVMDEEDVHEIMLATYPTGTSGWMGSDTVDRLRKETGLEVTRVVVRPDQAREPLARPGVTRVAVIADDALANGGLVEALRERADRQPMATVLLYPMALDVPGWTDEAEEVRSAASSAYAWRSTVFRRPASRLAARSSTGTRPTPPASRATRTRPRPSWSWRPGAGTWTRTRPSSR